MPKKQIPQVKKPAELAPEARQIIRQAIKVSLATNDRKKEWPFLSLTSVATLIDGIPILLLSNIAHHTRNIAVDPHVSLLFDHTPHDGSPLEHGRITLHGLLEKNNSSEVEQRFMTRHPEAIYAQFADFDFYTLTLKSAHYVAGFGSTTTLSPKHLLQIEQNAGLRDNEAHIITHMNTDHQDALQYMAEKTTATSSPLSTPSKPASPWVMTGIDSEGIDLMSDKKRHRILFPRQITTIKEARIMLQEMSAR